MAEPAKAAVPAAKPQTTNTTSPASNPATPAVKVATTQPAAPAAPAAAVKPAPATVVKAPETPAAAAAVKAHAFAHRTNQPVSRQKFHDINLAVTNFQAALNTIEVGSKAVDHTRINTAWTALEAAYNSLV